MIRPATLADIDALLELELVFPGDRISRASFRHLLTKAHARVFVAEHEGRIKGNAVVTFRSGFHSAHLYSIVVAPDARGRGYAGLLLEAVEAAALEEACVSIRLEVREDNESAIRLYERHGYEHIGSTADYYEDRAAAVRMRKRLSPAPPPDLPTVPYYEQTLDFTCGPAVLMMAAAHLGSPEPLERRAELQVWREATTIFMMSGHGGCSAHGLALAALRRGLDTVVYTRDDAIPFHDSVRDPEKKAVIAETHAAFLDEYAARGGRTIVHDFGVADVEREIAAGGVPLVLMSGYRLYGQREPHWLLITGSDAQYLYLHDPYVPEGRRRSESVHLPLPKGDFERVSRFGKARHRYMVVVRPANE